MKERDYNDLVEMFESDGWKVFIGQVQATEEGATKGSVTSAVTNDQWQYLRGWISCSRGTLGYETFVRLSYEQQLRDEAVEEEEGDTYDATL